MLAYYDPTKPLVISCDASLYTIEQFLHRKTDGSMIVFASQTLGSAEWKCAQLNREELTVVFPTQHFQKFITGRMATFYTDHQQLLGILCYIEPVPRSCQPAWHVGVSNCLRMTTTLRNDWPRFTRMQTPSVSFPSRTKSRNLPLQQICLWSTPSQNNHSLRPLSRRRQGTRCSHSCTLLCKPAQLSLSAVAEA